MEAVTQRDIEEWIEENTFECPLGRVSINQCKINRSRKPARQCRYGEIPMPPICEGCNYDTYHMRFYVKKGYIIK